MWPIMKIHTCIELEHVNVIRSLLFGNNVKLTAASLSKRAKSSLSSLTSSWALQDDDSWVKPTMSANKILHNNKRQIQDSILVQCSILLQWLFQARTILLHSFMYAAICFAIKRINQQYSFYIWMYHPKAGTHSNCMTNLRYQHPKT